MSSYMVAPGARLGIENGHLVESLGTTVYRLQPTGALNLASGSLMGLAFFGVALYVGYQALKAATK